MLVLLLLVLVFVPAFLSKKNSDFDHKNLKVEEAIIPILLIAAAAVSLAVGIYTFLQMRKMQKKNRPKPNQIDGTIADEGVSFCDIAGSPHVHPNITDLWNKKSEAIKQKTGGFLGIGKQTQVTGYRYYTSFAAFIGNRIEKFIAINFDKRGWIAHDQKKHPTNMLPVNGPNLFGQDAGGVVGNIDLEFGYPQPQQNLAYKQHFDLVSAYPYQSYLVFRGNTIDKPFYFGNSNYMKEMLLWVRRIHVKNDGNPQWHDGKAEIFENMPNSEVSSRFIQGDNIYYIIGARDIPAGIEVTAYTNCIGGITGNFSYTETTPFTPAGSGIPIPDDMKKKYGIYDIFKDEVILAAGYTVPSYSGIFLDHADAWYPNWDEKQNKTMTNEVVVKSVGFQAIYLIELKSRTKHENFSITFGSERSAVISNIEVENFNDGYVQGRCLAIVLDDYDQAIIEFDTKNDLNSGTYHAIRSHIQCAVLDIEIIYGGKIDGIDGIDINPIHKIREILTDDTAMAKPEADVNDINFTKAADRIYDEGLGVSWAIDEKSCIDAIEELCYHIEAGIRVNRQTGLYEMVLFRDDWFAEDEIHDIAENKIKDLSLEVMNSDDIVNQLNVTYYDRKRIKNSTFLVYENGSILTMGKANAESIEFPYFMNMRNAEIVANWKLKQYSTPAWKGTFTTGWREARKWNRYDLVRITWSKKWQGTILARIMKIDLGNGLNNEVVIEFEEVVPYSGEMNTSIVVDAPVDDGPQSPQPSVNAVFEAPYYLTVLLAGQTNADLELSNNPDIGYVAAIAAKPQNNSLNALLYTDGGVGEFEQVSRLDYCDILQLDQPVTETSSSFTVTGLLTQSANSSNLILLNYELMGFVSFDDVTKVLTVKRGVLDTVPKKHSSGSLFVFDLPDVAFDSTQYSYGEIIEAQVLTTTPSGIQELSDTGQPIEIRARAIRPYPPANVKINGEYWPVEIETDLVLTWVDRNRLQQTGGEILSWFDGGVTIESGTSTMLTIKELDVDEQVVATHNIDATGTNTYTLAISAMQANTRFVKVTLKTVRDGYECLQPFECVLINLKSISMASNINAKYLSDTLTSVSSIIKGYSSGMVDQVTDIKLEFFNE